MGDRQGAAASSRLGLRNTGGEIVEVQGGHIVRSTGRKDRHSKVCTAKGPRDRRVRLSAHTAIQFYDVQDRLGYDRPSKAVDWLIKKAKSAIDELAELPAWKPTNCSTMNPTDVEHSPHTQQQQQHQHHQQQQQQQHFLENENQPQLQMSNHDNMLPPSLDSDSIADTIKSFFPMGASTGVNVNPNSSAMQFQSFPPPDLLSRTSSQSQDLRLSLQSFQDPIFHSHQQAHHQQQHQNNPTHQQNEQANIFSGFDGSGWLSASDNHPVPGFQRMVAWSGGGGDVTTAASTGFMFNTPTPTTPFLQPLFGQTQMFSQRGPLQSSYTPSVRAWIDSPAVAFSAAAAALDHHHQQQQSLSFHPASISGFASGGGGFSGFRIPARIQGEEEEHDGISDKPSSASSDSRH